jgi:hypothetical protein
MDAIKKATNSTKEFVKKHRVAIAVVVTSACWLKINHIALAQHNEFLKEKGLYEEFYTEPELEDLA